MQFKKSWVFIFLLILWAIFPVGHIAAQDERLVLAFYYAWFDWNTWANSLPYQPEQPYMSADPSIIAQHVEQARQAGIDALVLDWYGSQIENNQTEPNFRLLLEQANNAGLKACLTMDLAGPFLTNTDAIQSSLIVLRDQHATHPAYLKVDGKAVVFFWRQEQYSVATWQALRNQVDPDRNMLWIAEGSNLDYLDAFDGLYLYSVAWSDNPASILVRWGNEVRNWNTQNDTFRYWVATTMPGYDDTATGRSDSYSRARSDGAYYRSTWDGVMRSRADWVVITSFNEWMEGSQIEPATSYGDFYLNLTSELASTYRNAVDPTATSIPSTATPILTPTVVFTPTSTLIPTDTPEPVFTPTATLIPTETPFLIPTPTATPTFEPTVALPQPSLAPAYNGGGEGITPTPTYIRHMTVEGSNTPKSCFPMSALALPLAGIVLKLTRKISV